ncbi:hypothetical protein FF1_041921 [Malus domestica]
MPERAADIKTRTLAMKCLTAFSEAIGPGLIFERLYKIMKEHKNPKVLSEGVLWMVSAVEDFGVAHVKLKDLIDFCKETGLQSTAAATRNSTIKLLGAIHKFVGPDIKGFLTDVKPALFSALDAEYEKNPFEVRLESKEAVNKILEEANKRIQPTGTNCNKNLVAATLTVVGNVASAIGAPAEMLSKGILSDVLKCLGDNKKHMRECT